MSDTIVFLNNFFDSMKYSNPCFKDEHITLKEAHRIFVQKTGFDINYKRFEKLCYFNNGSPQKIPTVSFKGFNKKRGNIFILETHLKEFIDFININKHRVFTNNNQERNPKNEKSAFVSCDDTSVTINSVREVSQNSEYSMVLPPTNLQAVYQV